MSSEQSNGQDTNHESTFKKSSNTKRAESSSGSVPDVFLDAPQLNADGIDLEIENLDIAKIIKIGKVKVNISGLEAQLLLEVRLEKVVGLVDRLLDSVDRGVDRVSDLIKDKPEVLQSVTQTAGNLLSEVVGDDSDDSDDPVEQEGAGESSNKAEGNGSASESVDEEGRTVQRSVDESGNIVETTLNGSGEIADERVVGNLEDFLVEEEFFDEEGFIVSRMKDETGFVVEGVSDQEGNIIDVKNV